MKYTFEQKMEILLYARDHGVRNAEKDLKISASTICRWNKKYGIYKEQEVRKFSEAQKIEILQYTEDNGISAAVKKYNVGASVISGWANEYGIYTKSGKRKKKPKARIRRPVAQIFEIVDFAINNTVKKAVEKFNVADATIRRWIKHYAKCDRRAVAAEKECVLSVEEIFKVLEFAGTNSVLSAVEKYNIAESTIRFWNNQFHVFDSRMCRVFDGALRKKIIESAKANSVPEAARLFDVTTDQIRGWIDAENNRKKS